MRNQPRIVDPFNLRMRRQELSALTPGSKRLFNCCVDLGFEAETTTGNAQEIAAWARARGYDHLIVVTSDYHMPRSLVEIRSAARGVQLTPYAVSTPSLDDPCRVRTREPTRLPTFEWMK